MIKNKDALEAYNTIVKYCYEGDCQTCIFQGAEDSRCECILDTITQSVPERWQKLEIE